jgi:hypothetical protein
MIENALFYSRLGEDIAIKKLADANIPFEQISDLEHLLQRIQEEIFPVIILKNEPTFKDDPTSGTAYLITQIKKSDNFYATIIVYSNGEIVHQEQNDSKIHDLSKPDESSFIDAVRTSFEASERFCQDQERMGKWLISWLKERYAFRTGELTRKVNLNASLSTLSQSQFMTLRAVWQIETGLNIPLDKYDKMSTLGEIMSYLITNAREAVRYRPLVGYVIPEGS